MSYFWPQSNYYREKKIRGRQSIVKRTSITIKVELLYTHFLMPAPFSYFYVSSSTFSQTAKLLCLSVTGHWHASSFAKRSTMLLLFPPSSPHGAIAIYLLSHHTICSLFSGWHFFHYWSLTSDELFTVLGSPIPYCALLLPVLLSMSHSVIPCWNLCYDTTPLHCIILLVSSI